MLEIAFRRNNTVAILDLSGNIDIDASNLIEKVAWCLENGYEDILCNLGDINLIDYAGLSVIAIAYKNVLNHKGRMKFVNAAEHIKKVFSLMCLDKVFETYEDEETAINSFKEDKIIAEIQKKNLRRRFKRLPLDIDVEFKAKSKEEKSSRGKVLNISGVGLLIFTDKTYPLGEILNVKLNLSPKIGSVEFDANVVWLVEKEFQPQIYPGMGLEFHNMESGLQKKIADFVDRNLPSGCMI